MNCIYPAAWMQEALCSPARFKLHSGPEMFCCFVRAGISWLVTGGQPLCSFLRAAISISWMYVMVARSYLLPSTSECLPFYLSHFFPPLLSDYFYPQNIMIHWALSFCNVSLDSLSDNKQVLLSWRTEQWNNKDSFSLIMKTCESNSAKCACFVLPGTLTKSSCFM